MNVNHVRLVDSVIQMYYILAAFVYLFSQLLRQVLKSQLIVVDLSISPCSSVIFCIMHFQAMLLGFKHLGFLCRLN